MERPYYFIGSLLALCSKRNYEGFQRLLGQHSQIIGEAAGSSKNHQAWSGGYVDHITEVMNIAHWLYTTSPRPLPFGLGDALEVMFLHDLEKPWKYTDAGKKLQGWDLSKKHDRKLWRNTLIGQFDIELSEAQWNALAYVEGVPDSEYTPNERTMGELAAFCHCCDILSARLWHDKGRERRW